MAVEFVNSGIGMSGGGGTAVVTLDARTPWGVGDGGTGAVNIATARNNLLTFAGQAVGDMYFRNAPTAVARLPIGSNGQFLAVANGVPTWVPGVTSGIDTVSTNVSANGTTLGQATVLTSQLNEVTTGTGGVRWDDPVPGGHRFIRNNTAAAILFYPPSGGRINNLDPNAGIYIQPDTTAFIKAISVSPARLVTVP